MVISTLFQETATTTLRELATGPELKRSYALVCVVALSKVIHAREYGWLFRTIRRKLAYRNISREEPITNAVLVACVLPRDALR